MICASVYLLVFIKNLLVHLAKKVLLMQPLTFGGDYRSSRDKFAAVLETAALNEADLGEYCRKRGLYSAQIAAWRSACEQAN